MGVNSAGGAKRGRCFWAATASALALAIGGMAIPQAAMAQAAPAGQVEFDIPAQDLNKALLAFTDRAGLQIFYDLDKVAGRRSSAVRGSYAPMEALSQLLVGTGLTFRATGNRITLEPAPQSANGSIQLGPVRVEGDAANSVGHASPPQAVLGAIPPVYAGGQVARGAKLGILGNVDILDAPFNVTSYTQKTIADQQAIVVSDVAANDPSVRLVGSAGGYSDSLLIRGFQVPYTSIAFNGLYGLVPVTRVPVEAVERVEVLKGPNALLSGMAPDGAVGGTVNIVPKRATDAPLTRFTAGFVSDSQFYGHADIGRRFGDASEWGVRFNGAYRGGDTAVDSQSRKFGLASLGLDYQGERLRLSLDAVYSRDKHEGTGDIGVIFLGPVIAPPDGSTPLALGGSYDTRDTTIAGRAEYDLAGNVTAYASLGYRHNRSGGPYALNVVDANGDAYATLYGQEYKYNTLSGEAGFRMKLETGPVGHSISLGTTYYRDHGFISASYDGVPTLTNLYDPVELQQSSYPGEPQKQTHTKLNSFVAADTLSFAQDRVLLTLGIRHQRVQVDGYDAFGGTGALLTSYDESATTPMVGLVVKLAENISLYGNYIEGLQQGPTAPTTAGLENAGEVFSPYKSKQYEVGIKVDWGSIITTASLFQISQPNALTVNNRYTLDGEKRNRGLELNVSGEISDGLRLLGGATFIDSDVTKASTSALSGKNAVGVPDMQINVGAEWDLPFVPGLTLNGRVIHTGRQYIDADNIRNLPRWTRWDGGIRYSTAFGATPVTFRGNVTNLFGKNYWSAYQADAFAVLGAPRTFSLSATFDF